MKMIKLTKREMWIVPKTGITLTSLEENSAIHGMRMVPSDKPSMLVQQAGKIQQQRIKTNSKH